MSLKSDGLTDIGMGAGFTTNFHVQYETSLFDSLPTPQANTVKANLIANANALLAVIENEFTVTTGWFNTPGGKFGTGHRQVVNLNQADGSGANNSGYGSNINLDAQSGNNNHGDAGGRVGMLFMNEWVEILMSLSNGKWNAANSSGEGLSQWCGIARFLTGHYSYYNAGDNRLFTQIWLNTHPRQDWVTSTENTDGNMVSFGCALGFLFYLTNQLNFSINQVIAAGASDLATTYHTLTGDSGNPFPFFAGLIEHVFPSTGDVSLPGPVFDNPFPLAEMAFWVDKDTFGKDEVQDVINTNAGKWPKAFWLVVDGFSKNSFNALGVTIPAPTGPFASLAGVSISQNPDIDYENAANPQAPQRIRVPFDITFTNPSLADFPTSGSQLYELDAFLTIAGVKVPGSDAATQFELIAGADPYFTNINRAQNNVFYLSQDLRVFTATPGQNDHPVPGAPAFSADSVPGAFNYIEQLLTWLNGNFNDPGGPDPFDTVLPGQGGALQGDSSVTPYTLDLSHFPNFHIYNNYNFAIARVRLRGSSGPSGAARNVRVFFRLWSTETADTDYQTGSTYPFTPDAAGQPGKPMVGVNHHTLPFFASGDLFTNSDYNPGGANIHDIEIPSGRDRTWFYYGCFLNLYDPFNQIDGKAIQAWLNGTHHCIVAQIADDDAPIYAGASPESSDKLAQRNLQVTTSDNPGAADTHRIPQTFDIRPTLPLAAGPNQSVYPDELMIDWGAIPAGSVASIYWPQVQAADVLALASQLYSTHTLSASDVHTIQCKVTSGVTYVPIPAGAGENFAGLFTVDLPTTVVTGQEFDIVIRRISTRQMPPVIELRSIPVKEEGGRRGRKPIGKEGGPGEIPQLPRSWRYVVGTFSVKIPVATAETMLLPEENTLAIMKWRLQQMAPSDRWYPVLERYISYIAARVDGLGGDSGSIQPSPTGVPPTQIVPVREKVYTGKVCELLYDCFGDFEGFILCDCDEERSFKTHERGIEELALRACKERLTLSVYVRAGKEAKIIRLAIRC